MWGCGTCSGARANLAFPANLERNSGNCPHQQLFNEVISGNSWQSQANLLQLLTVASEVRIGYVKNALCARAQRALAEIILVTAILTADND